MHEFKHGELKSGRRGRGGKVKSRKQAIAIALHEAGQSKYDTRAERLKGYAKSRRAEAMGRTGQQEEEGASRIGARGKRESTRAMGGKNATRARARKAVRKAGRRATVRKATVRKAVRKAGVRKAVRKTVRRARVKRAVRRMGATLH
jgi:hypothetical protein